MNRYIYIDNYIAPPIIYPGDVFYLLGTNVKCEVVSVENNIIGYIMRQGTDETTYITRSEFECRFEFGYESQLTSERVQSYYNDESDYEYDYYDIFDDYEHQYDKIYEDLVDK